jgi:hypothetical protein
MRGHDPHQSGMHSYISAEERVPENHPLLPIRAMVDAVLQEMSHNLARLYAKRGRPSIPPEGLLRALLLQVRDATVFTKNRDHLLRGEIAQVFFRHGKRIKSIRGAWDKACLAAGLVNENGDTMRLFMNPGAPESETWSGLVFLSVWQWRLADTKHARSSIGTTSFLNGTCTRRPAG